MKTKSHPPMISPDQRHFAPQAEVYLQEINHDLQGVPITAKMGFNLVHYDGVTLQLAGPLEPNLNDKMTAFGGSLASAALISGWSWMVLLLRQYQLAEADVVIADAQFQFLSPVRSDFFAEVSRGEGGSSALEEDSEIQRFLRCYQRKGRAKLAVQVSVFDACDQRLAVSMTGVYGVSKR